MHFIAGNAREAASRLVQALRVFAIDPFAGEAESAVESLPKWAFEGGAAFRKKRPRGRPAKEVKTLKTGLGELLEAARASELQGFAEGTAREHLDFHATTGQLVNQFAEVLRVL